MGRSKSLGYVLVLISASACAQSHLCAAEFKRAGVAWELTLSHAEVQKLDDAAFVASIGIGDATVVAAITASVAYIQFVDAVGGNQVVAITGIGGSTVVTPKGKSPYGG